MNDVQDPDPYHRLLGALEPWINQVVIVGGWAHCLYRLHSHAQQLDYPPLMTLDADVAVPVELPVQEQNIRDRLIAAGFTEEFLGQDQPPATHYRLGNESGFYAEFLTPLVGGMYDRERRRRPTTNISGINSQRLRHIQLLLNHPWSINLDHDGVITVVYVANPASFLVQKVLIHRDRGREDRAKDILYMHDTLEVFGGRLEELRELWLNSVAPQLNRRDLNTILTGPESLFGRVSDDIRRAANISAERQLSPETLREACHYGFTLFVAPDG